MLPNTDPRYVRSRSKLRAAFLEIADEDPDLLTVSAICERTGVDRATFYRHFDDLDGLVEDALGDLAVRGAEEWAATTHGTGDQQAEALAISTRYLRHIAEHWKVYRWALGPGGSARAIYAVLRRNMQGVTVELAALGATDEDELEYLAAMLGGAFVGVLLHWLESDRPDRNPEDLARWFLAAASQQFPVQVH